MKTHIGMLVALALATGCSSSSPRTTAPTTSEGVATTILPTSTTNTTAPSSTTTGKPAASTADRVALLAAAARARFGVGRIVEGTLTVINRVAPAGSLEAGSSAGRPFTDVERGAVEAALAPNPVIWADRELVYPADQPVPMQSPNVVLTLGEPVVDGDHAVIESGLGCGGLCGRGGASAFSRQPDGSWSYEGPTGIQWEA
jgi:hypothetical protein